YLVTGGSAGANVPAGIQWSRCTVNPRAGREAEWPQEYVPAQVKKRVVVVGGGPAGLECARVARERGHEVIVLERNAEVGGQLNIAAKAPAREGFLDLVRYHTFQARKLGIDIRLGVTATAESVLALKPDAVVLATGSTQIPAQFPGADRPNVVGAWDVLQEKAQVGQKVVVASKETHFEAVSVAEFLAARGKDVEFLHEWLNMGTNIEHYTKATVFHRFYSAGVKPTVCADIKSFDGKTVIAYNVLTGEERRIEGVDTVVVAYGSRGDNSLYRALKDKVSEIYLIGAAYRPRLCADATRDGAETGRAI
ncbi:MAG: FAD-dependent oxidoreductase, partial [Chloroflexi bacterium]|nr:FAD-dependent oxidoreductase [Chloroflexota bacterium]